MNKITISYKAESHSPVVNIIISYKNKGIVYEITGLSVQKILELIEEGINKLLNEQTP